MNISEEIGLRVTGDESGDLLPVEAAATSDRRVFDLRQATDRVAEATTVHEELEALLDLAALAWASAELVWVAVERSRRR